MTSVLDGVRDGRLERPDGRVVAWSDWGEPDGIPLLRVPGTPGCRYNMRADRTAWAERGLRAITTERPGFGASTRLPGRGFAAPADDIAAVLDELGLDRVHVIGGSGGAPHELAFAARHPDRVRAMTILVGAAPTEDGEYAEAIDLNRIAHEMVRAGDIDGLRSLMEEQRAALLADPLGGFEVIMAKAPEADRAVMATEGWQHSFVIGVREALAQGVDGWLDEALAIQGDWSDVAIGDVRTSITWWHAPGDANAPLSAARRLVDRLDSAELRLFGEHEGHMAGYHREGEILDELLARG